MARCDEFNIKPAKSVSDAASDVDYIITSLPKTQDVQKVMTMEGGIFKSAGPDTIILDSSTISSVAAKEMNSAARENGMYFYDSPMSGGVPGA